MRKRKIMIALFSIGFLLSCLSGCNNEQAQMNELEQYKTINIDIVTPFKATDTQEFTYRGITEKDIKYDFSDKIQLGKYSFSLDKVDYEVLSSKEVTEPKTITEQKTYSNLLEQKVDAPETIVIQRDGKELVSKKDTIQYESEGDAGTAARSVTLTSNTDYGYTTYQPTANKTKTISYHDTATGKDISPDLPFQEMKILEDWHWKDDVVIPITVTTYDANYYMLNGKKIPKNDETPALAGHEGDLLDALGLPSNNYKINRYVWDGEPYTKDGELCRNAVAYGERYVTRCQAVYQDTVSLPSTETFKATVTYIAKAEEQTGQTEYKVKAVATYTTADVSNTSILILVVSVSLIALIILALLIIFILAKKRKKEKEKQQ